MPHRAFVPAAGHDWLLPLYDPVCRLMGAGSARDSLVDQAQIEPESRVLDIGCGTGTLVSLLKRRYPDVEVVGLDPDPKALARARRKAAKAGVRVQLDRGYADSLPYPDASLDRVLSTFMLHHLDLDAKRGTLREARRVLRPGGSLHVLDFAGGEPRADGLLARLLHSRETLHGNDQRGIPALMREAGFEEAAEVAHRRTIFGRVGYFRARLAASGSAG